LKLKKAVTVSDHAMIRYLERVEGVNTNATIRQKILTPQMSQLISQLGDGDYPTTEGFKLRVRKGTIVTIII
jgi:hypothetical protein